VGEELTEPGRQDDRCGGGLAELSVEVAQQLAEGVEISMAGWPGRRNRPEDPPSKGTGTAG
jgi:hypothetical protein